MFVMGPSLNPCTASGIDDTPGDYLLTITSTGYQTKQVQTTLEETQSGCHAEYKTITVELEPAP